MNRYLHQIAEAEGRDPLDVMLDLSLDENLETAFLGRFLNVGDAGVTRLLKHEAGVVALSDAGAHLIYMCDAGFGLHFLSHWVRERGVLPLGEAVRMLTSRAADVVGITDRGRLGVGRPADVVVFDPETVGASGLRRVRDLPAGADRLVADATGIEAVVVNGTLLRERGRDTVDPQGALPGRLLRNGAARA